MWIFTSSFLLMWWGMDYGFNEACGKQFSKDKYSFRAKITQCPWKVPCRQLHLPCPLWWGAAAAWPGSLLGLNPGSSWLKRRDYHQALPNNFHLACQSEICVELRWCLWDGSYILNYFLGIKYILNKVTAVLGQANIRSVKGSPVLKPLYNASFLGSKCWCTKIYASFSRSTGIL